MRHTSMAQFSGAPPLLSLALSSTNQSRKLAIITSIGIVIHLPHALGLADALGLTLALATSTTP